MHIGNEVFHKIFQGCVTAVSKLVWLLSSYFFVWVKQIIYTRNKVWNHSKCSTLLLYLVSFTVILFNEMGDICGEAWSYEKYAHNSGQKNWREERSRSKLMLKSTLQKWHVRLLIEFKWLWIRFGSWHLWMRQWTSGFNKMWGISWPPKGL
jgi:hypothetical protein